MYIPKHNFHLLDAQQRFVLRSPLSWDYSSQGSSRASFFFFFFFSSVIPINFALPSSKEFAQQSSIEFWQLISQVNDLTMNRSIVFVTWWIFSFCKRSQRKRKSDEQNFLSDLPNQILHTDIGVENIGAIANDWPESGSCTTMHDSMQQHSVSSHRKYTLVNVEKKHLISVLCQQS